MVQLNQELDLDGTRSFYQVGSPKANPSPGNWLQFSRFVDHSPLPTTDESFPVETLSAPQFLWGSSPTLHSNGTAPSGLPLDRHFGFLPESPEASFMNNNVGYGGLGLGHNDGNHVLNTGISTPRRNMPDNGSSYFRMRSSPMLSPGFLDNGPYPGQLPTAMESLTDRIRRIEKCQIEIMKQFHLDLDKIQSGEDPRTTLMIKNIPNKYTTKMLLAAIDEDHKGTYDFLYLPIDVKNKCNMGYAFINMRSPLLIIPFYETFKGKKWEKFNSDKAVDLAYARIQGKHALVNHFKNSTLNGEKRSRPIVFNSDGSEAGDQRKILKNKMIQEHHPSIKCYVSDAAYM